MFNDLIPMLETNDLRATIQFYAKLGFSIKGKHAENGKLTWVALQKDKVIIFFSDRFTSTAKSPISMTGSLYIYPDDVDKLWATLEDKAIIEWPLQNFHYGMREFAIKDNNGYRLIFGQEIPE